MHGYRSFSCNVPQAFSKVAPNTLRKPVKFSSVTKNYTGRVRHRLDFIRVTQGKKVAYVLLYAPPRVRKQNVALL